MQKDIIDASVGLRFTLELLKRYRESGLLQATISRLSSISEKCQVSITVIRGEVISCLAKDQKGHRYTVNIHTLIKLDKDRGPFEWNLLPLAQVEKSTPTPLHLQITQVEKSTPTSLHLRIAPVGKSTPTPLQISQFLPGQGQWRQNNIHANKASNSPIPYVIADFDYKRLKEWDTKPKKALFVLYSLFDGNRTIEDIKQAAPLPPRLVEKGLRVLLSMKVIAISS
jgi:hypothetical protein